MMFLSHSINLRSIYDIADWATAIIITVFPWLDTSAIIKNKYIDL